MNFISCVISFTDNTVSFSNSLPQEDGCSKVKNFYIKSSYYSSCEDYGLNTDETWMNGDWFYTTKYDVSGDGGKDTESSPPDNYTRWIITQSKEFTRKGIEKVIRSTQTYVYLVLTSQVQARSSIVCNSAFAVNAQQVFNSRFTALINEDYSVVVDTNSYHSILEHTLSKLDFSVSTGINMLPSNLNLHIGKTVGYNDKILLSKAYMKIGSNKKTTFSLSLSSNYYAFGCKKYICKKCYMRNRLRSAVGICNT